MYLMNCTDPKLLNCRVKINRNKQRTKETSKQTRVFIYLYTHVPPLQGRTVYMKYN